MIRKATLEKNYVTLISRGTISHSQMTTANPNKVFVLTRILETDELFSMLNRGVGLCPSTYCSFLVQPQVLLATFSTRPQWLLIFHWASTLQPGFFCAKLFTSPQPVCVSAWGFFLQGWDLAFLFARLHEVPVRPAHQPLKVHLNDNTTIWCINHPLLPTFCHLQSVILFHNLVVKENAK